MSTLLYFTYGSNMSTPRLLKRTPSARFISTAQLENHKLKFHKKSIYGSGKCNIEYTNNLVDIVFGVLFEITANEKSRLDHIEGLGTGYDEKWVTVIDSNGEMVSAVTYYAISIDSSLRPYHWYKEHVLRGAKEHNLPVDYIKFIEAIESMPDPDIETHENELSIYY